MTTSDIKRLRELAGKVAHAEKMAKEKLSDAIEVNRSLARAQFANALIEAALSAERAKNAALTKALQAMMNAAVPNAPEDDCLHAQMLAADALAL